MNTIAILFVWQVVTGKASYNSAQYEWKNLGEFVSMEACDKAAKNLAIDTKMYRCINKSTGETK